MAALIPLSWVAVVMEIVGALIFSAAGVYALRRRAECEKGVPIKVAP